MSDSHLIYSGLFWGTLKICKGSKHVDRDLIQESLSERKEVEG